MIAAIIQSCLRHLDAEVPDWARVTMIDRAEMACYAVHTFDPDRVERICARVVAICMVEWRRGKLARVVHEVRA